MASGNALMEVMRTTVMELLKVRPKLRLSMIVHMHMHVQLTIVVNYYLESKACSISFFLTILCSCQQYSCNSCGSSRRCLCVVCCHPHYHLYHHLLLCILCCWSSRCCSWAQFERKNCSSTSTTTACWCHSCYLHTASTSLPSSPAVRLPNGEPI